MDRETIFITKNQIKILTMSLMSLTRDDEFFEFALASGARSEEHTSELQSH